MSKSKNKNKNNITKLTAISVLWSTIILQAVSVPFFESRNMSLTEILLIQSMFSLLLSFLEIPTGILTDRWGPKKALIIASIFRSLGAGILVYSENIYHIGLAYAALAVGNSFFSGTNISLFYTHYNEMKEPKKPASRYLSNIHVASLAAVTVSALCSGFISEISLQTTANVNFFISSIPLLLAFSITSSSRRVKSDQKADEKSGHKSEEEPLVSKLKRTFRRNPTVVRIIVAMMSIQLVPFLAVYLVQGIWVERGMSHLALGFLFALQNGFGVVSGKLIDKLMSSVTTKQLLAIIGLTPVIGFFLAGQEQIPLIILGVFCFEICRAFSFITFNTWLNERISDTNRATILSSVSFGSRIMLALFGPLLAATADLWNVSTAMYFGAAIYLIIGIFVITPLNKILTETSLKES